MIIKRDYYHESLFNLSHDKTPTPEDDKKYADICNKLIKKYISDIKDIVKDHKEISKCIKFTPIKSLSKCEKFSSDGSKEFFAYPYKIFEQDYSTFDDVDCKLGDYTGDMYSDISDFINKNPELKSAKANIEEKEISNNKFECYVWFKYNGKMIKEDTDISTKPEKIDLTKYFAFNPEDGMAPSLVGDAEKVFYRDPVYNKAIMEHFDMLDKKTRRTLLSMNEAGQNTVLMSLTSKLYDKIVEKCDDIDYGEIPKTKGDVRKLSKYESMKECISLMHDILREYNQDTGPVDELSVALANIESRRDIFERAYRYNTELPIAMYCNVVLGIITGITYMISTCIEFIKDPGTENFRISLDKIAYAKSKDHLIYNTLKSFNKSCANKEFDKAMEAVLKANTKNFGEAAGVVLGGIAIGVLGTFLVLIPVLREFIFLFYYLRVKVSDFFDIQADILQANAYSLEANTTLSPTERKKIMAKQLKHVERFRRFSNKFAVEMKKAEVASAKDKKMDDDTKMLIDDIGGIDSKTSALF